MVDVSFGLSFFLFGWMRLCLFCVDALFWGGRVRWVGCSVVSVVSVVRFFVLWLFDCYSVYPSLSLSSSEPALFIRLNLSSR